MSAEVFRFGDFELDVRRRLLRSAVSAEVIPLTSKAFDTLQYLIRHAGEVVHKSELIDAVWPGVVVEENNLTQAISALRRALGETPREHRYIATVPGRGYRFVSTVHPTEQGVAREAFSSDAHVPGYVVGSAAGKRHLWLPVRIHLNRVVATVVGAALFAVLVGVFIVSVMPSDQTSAGIVQLNNLRLISEGSAHHQQPALSPDGSMVVYVSDATGTNQIYVSSTAGGWSQQITFLEGGAGHPAWSPGEDGMIYFHDATNGGIYRVGILGTPEPKLIIAEGKNPSVSYRGARASGTIAYEHDGRITLANADGTRQRAIRGVPDRPWRFQDKWPTLSPDGERVAFFLHERGPRGDIWTISVNGDELTRVTSDLNEAGPLLWSSDGLYIYFVSERRGEKTLWRVLADGDSDPEPVTSGVGEYRDFALSADNTRIVFTHAEPRARFVVWDPVSDERKILYEGRLKNSFPAVSNDGQSIAYFAKTGPFGSEQILLLSLVGDQDPIPITIPEPGELHIMPRWTPDDAEICFYNASASWSLDCVFVDGSGSIEQFSEFDWDSNKDVAFSPEDDRIVYVEGDPLEPGNLSKRRTVIRDVASGRLTVLPTDIVFAPTWTDEATYVLGTSADGVALCPDDGGRCDVLFEYDADLAHYTDDPTLGHYAQFSWDQTRIFFTRRTEDPLILELWVGARDGTDEQALFRYGPVDPLDGRFQVLPGDRILWSEYEPGPAKLWVAAITETGN